MFERIRQALGEPSRTASAVASAPAAVDHGVEIDRLLAEGNALEDSGSYAAALERYQQARALDPGVARVWVNIGNALNGRDDAPGAQAAFREALRLDPHCVSAHFNLGNLACEQGDGHAALAAYRAALALRPDMVDAEIGVGLAHEALREPGPARAAYERALVLAPDHPGAAANLERLSVDVYVLQPDRWQDGAAQHERAGAPPAQVRMAGRRRVLNVGGNSKSIPIPAVYSDWEHLLLDIDPTGNPDVCADAREMQQLEPEQFDAIYNSHNLEHYFHHDVPRVLAGFRHVLKADGFAQILVPDMAALFRFVVDRGLDIDDVAYDSTAGPILVRDVIYGFGKQIESSGVDFYAHKTGFTPLSLTRMLQRCGFPYVYLAAGKLEVRALAFKRAPGAEARATWMLSDA